MNRRKYLYALAATTALAGCEMPEQPETPTQTGTPSETGTPGTPQKTTTEGREGFVNIVDAGADPSGEQPIDDVLASAAEDGMTVVFPPGRYRLGQFEGHYADLTLAGRGATIVPTQREALTNMLVVEGPNNVVEGFLFDYRNVKMPPTITIYGPDGWVFRNCAFLGVQQTDLPQQTSYCLYPNVTESSGTGTIERVYMGQGSANPNQGDNRGGIWFGPHNLGTIRINGVWMEHWSENTIYCHNSPGDVVVENSFFRNTNSAGTRVGGGTVLRNNTYVKDGPIPSQRWSGTRLMRGVWCSGGKSEFGQKGRLLIEDCDFVFRNSKHVGDALDIEHPPEEVVVRNCRVTQDERQPILVRNGTTLTLEELQVTGETSAVAIEVGDATRVVTASGHVQTNGPVSNRKEISRKMVTSDAVSAETSPPLDNPLETLRAENGGTTDTSSS